VAKLTTNHSLFWFGTAASIPAGFSRRTQASIHGDATLPRFIIGVPNGFDTFGAGGSLTHTHATTEHRHIGTPHSHDLSGTEVTQATTGSHPTTGGGSTARADATHAHAASPLNTTTESSSFNAITTSGNTSILPPFVEALLIMPDADNSLIPTSATALFKTASPPNGFIRQNVNPDLTGRYIHIAADATTGGGATGGSYTPHTHDLPAHSHDTPGTHQHVGVSSEGGAAATSGQVGIAQPVVAFNNALHHGVDWTVDSAGAIGNSAAVTPASSGTDPDNSLDHMVLAPMTNAGAASLPDGAIVPFHGTQAQLAALPDWRPCDGTQGTPNLGVRFVFCDFSSLGTTIAGEAGLNHAHGATFPTHGHTFSSHTHTVNSDSGVPSKRATIVAGPVARSAVGDDHSGDHTWSITSTVPTLANEIVYGTGSTLPSYPPYFLVLWVQYVGSPTVTILGGTIQGGQIGA
jgi:hypothetical protein